MKELWGFLAGLKINSDDRTPWSPAVGNNRKKANKFC